MTFSDIFGIMAMGEAFKFMRKVGIYNIAEYEKQLYYYVKMELENIPEVRMYAQNSDNINIPYISFNVKGMYHTDVANYLAYEHGIEVAAGTAGADIYVQSLVGVSAQEAYKQFVNGKPVGIVRISLGMYNTFSEIDRFVDALRNL